MKIFRIKLCDSKVYVDYVLLNCNTMELKLDVSLTFDESDAAVYEEDKAFKYLELLNKQNEGKCKFELEEVNLKISVETKEE